MSFTFQTVRVATGFDEEGMMVLDEEQRLVRLSDDNEVAAGQWYLEVGFGRIDGTNHPISTLDYAQAWISQRLAKRGLI
jgi:hypothetical protein